MITQPLTGPDLDREIDRLAGEYPEPAGDQDAQAADDLDDDVTS
jgi:hypothetical protein